MPKKKKAVPNRGDNRYEIKITVGQDLFGKPIRKSFYSTTSKSDAQKQALEWQVENKAKNLLGQNLAIDDKMLLSDWADKWLASYKESKVKVTSYNSSYERPTRLYIKPYFKDVMINNIKPIDISNFYGKIENRYSKSTCGKIKICLNAIFETAIDNDICSKNPCRNVKISSTVEKKEKRTYSQQERDNIIKFSKSHKYGLSIHIMLELGLRTEEVLALKWSDFDFAKKELHIQRTVTDDAGKTIISDLTKTVTSNRVIPISSDLANHCISERENDADYMITSLRGTNLPINNKAFTQKRYRTFFKDYQVSIKSTDFIVLTPHELRHTCGTLLYQKTHDIYAVSKFLGHASIDITTKYYLHADTDLLRNSLQMD